MHPLTNTLMASVLAQSGSTVNVGPKIAETEIRSGDLPWQATADEATPSAAAKKLEILLVITQQSGLDDEEIALKLGMPAFDVSVLLREMETEGLVVGR